MGIFLFQRRLPCGFWTADELEEFSVFPQAMSISVQMTVYRGHVWSGVQTVRRMPLHMVWNTRDFFKRP